MGHPRLRSWSLAVVGRPWNPAAAFLPWSPRCCRPSSRRDQMCYAPQVMSPGRFGEPPCSRGLISAGTCRIQLHGRDQDLWPPENWQQAMNGAKAGGPGGVAPNQVLPGTCVSERPGHPRPPLPCLRIWPQGHRRQRCFPRRMTDYFLPCGWARVLGGASSYVRN